MFSIPQCHRQLRTKILNPEPEGSSTAAVVDTGLIKAQYDVASLIEFGGSDYIVDGITTDYLIGVASSGGKKDMIITRLDSNSGDIEAYAVLPDIRWVWKSGVEETGNSPFGKTSPCSPRASTFALRARVGHGFPPLT